MALRTMVWLAAYVGGTVATLIKGPFYGLILYLFLFYTQLTSWGMEYKNTRCVLLASWVFLFSYLIHKKKRLSHFSNPQFKWLVLFFLNVCLLTPFAANPEWHKETLVDVAKLVVLYYLIARSIQDKNDYKVFIWVQVFGNFNFGIEAYTRGKISKGRLENIGGPGIMGSNYLSNHLLHIIPFIALFVLFGNRKEKIAGCVAGAFILNTLILCNSRGAFLGAGVMVILAFILGKRWMYPKIIAGLVLGVIGFIAVGGYDRVLNRMQTVETYEEDASAMGRILAWKAAIQMIKAHPFGKGGDGFKELSPIYAPEITTKEKRTLHNTYLMLGTDLGIQGFVLYCLFIGTTLWELHKIRARTGTSDDKFYQLNSLGIELGLLAFLAAATFGNRIYAESVYWYCALTSAFSNIQQMELAQPKS